MASCHPACFRTPRHHVEPREHGHETGATSAQLNGTPPAFPTLSLPVCSAVLSWPCVLRAPAAKRTAPLAERVAPYPPRNAAHPAHRRQSQPAACMHARGARLCSAVSRAAARPPCRLSPRPRRTHAGGWQQARVYTAPRAPWWRKARAWLAAMAEPMDASPTQDGAASAQDSVDVRPQHDAALWPRCRQRCARDAHAPSHAACIRQPHAHPPAPSGRRIRARAPR